MLEITTFPQNLAKKQHFGGSRHQHLFEQMEEEEKKTKIKICVSHF